MGWQCHNAVKIYLGIALAVLLVLAYYSRHLMFVAGGSLL